MFAPTHAIGSLECASFLPKKVDERMNDDLCRHVSDEEIRLAAFSLGALKVPRGMDLIAYFSKIIGSWWENMSLKLSNLSFNEVFYQRK